MFGNKKKKDLSQDQRKEYEKEAKRLKRAYQSEENKCDENEMLKFRMRE